MLHLHPPSHWSINQPSSHREVSALISCRGNSRYFRVNEPNAESCNFIPTLKKRTRLWDSALAGHRCVSTVRAPRDDSIRSPHLTAPGAALGFLCSPGRYQISPVRPLLYQPRCPPAKQMTAPAATAPSVTNDTSAHLLSISHPSRIAAKGEVVTRMPLHRLPAVNTGERVVSAAFWQ